MSDKLIKIAYLYEDLMNTYGDSGDVKILRFLLKREGYDTQVDNISLGDDFNAFDYDFVFFGGGQDFEQTVVAKDLPRHKETLEKYINSDKPMLCICGGYQLMGDYYKTARLFRVISFLRCSMSINWNISCLPRAAATMYIW